MMPYAPPFQLTPEILRLVAEICERVGRWSATADQVLTPQLRRENRIRTIQASLAIENNTLSVEQVTAVLAGKRVFGLPREIQEVRNAFAAYEAMPGWSPASPADLLDAHSVLMTGLVDEAGRFRTGGVGICRGEQLVHRAPPASRVTKLMEDLLGWLGTTDIHPLIASCIFHYELEFIHPFSDGNGRMGRLWQTLALSRWQPMMAFLPVESLIRERQADYYQALADADQASNATPFVRFMLGALLDAMAEALAAEGKSSEIGSEKILALLRAQPNLAARELAAHLDLTPRAVEKKIRKLKEQGRLRRVGPAKGGYWEILE